MKNYKVSFFKLERQHNESTRKTEVVDQEYIGTVYVDDAGVGPHFTLVAKAWRQAPSRYLYADKTIVERVV